MMSKAEGGDADAQVAPIAGGSGNAKKQQVGGRLPVGLPLLVRMRA